MQRFPVLRHTHCHALAPTSSESLGGSLLEPGGRNPTAMVWFPFLLLGVSLADEVGNLAEIYKWFSRSPHVGWFHVAQGLMIVYTPKKMLKELAGH